MQLKFDVDFNQVEEVKTFLLSLDNIEIVKFEENFNSGNFTITLISDRKETVLRIIELYFG